MKVKGLTSQLLIDKQARCDKPTDISDKLGIFVLLNGFYCRPCLVAVTLSLSDST